MPPRNVTDIESRKSIAADKVPAPISNHPKFFFDDRLVVIQIENVRFNVHKYQLIKSKTFTDLFAAAGQAEARGEPLVGSIDNPIKLEGFSASDFENLLTVLYADYFSDHHPQTNASLIVPAFRLANILKFSALRVHLLPLARKVLSDVDKIVLAREFDIKDWLVPSHVNLCQRSAPLTTAEATKLGIHSLLMISILRQDFPPKQSSTTTPICSGAYCSKCGNYHSSDNHCDGCSIYSDTSNLRPAKSTGTMQERLKEWVRNGCEFKT